MRLRVALAVDDARGQGNGMLPRITVADARTTLKFEVRSRSDARECWALNARHTLVAARHLRL